MARRDVPRLLLNRHSVGPFQYITNNSKPYSSDHQSRPKDLQLLGDLVKMVEFLVNKLDWTNDFEQLESTQRSRLETMSIVEFEKFFYRLVSNADDESGSRMSSKSGFRRVSSSKKSSTAVIDGRASLNSTPSSVTTNSSGELSEKFSSSLKLNSSLLNKNMVNNSRNLTKAISSSMLNSTTTTHYRQPSAKFATTAKLVYFKGFAPNSKPFRESSSMQNEK